MSRVGVTFSYRFPHFRSSRGSLTPSRRFQSSRPFLSFKQETLEQARQDAQLCNASVAHTFGVLKDELNGQGRLTRPAVHRCVRQLRAMTHNGAQHDETENLGDGKEVAGDPNYNPAAAEDVMDRLFDAVDVRDAGDVDFCEFASALSVRLLGCLGVQPWRIAHRPLDLDTSRFVLWKYEPRETDMACCRKHESSRLLHVLLQGRPLCCPFWCWPFCCGFVNASDPVSRNIGPIM